jgi:hypothetical protein
MEALSNVGGVWLGYSIYGTGGIGIAGVLTNRTLNSWTNISNGTWDTAGYLTIFHMYNKDTGIMYRITQMITDGYLDNPVFIEILNQSSF